MFVAIYRWTLKAGTEDQYLNDWAEVTRAGISEGLSLGSTLGRAMDGSFVAIARWPSKQQRDDWFARSAIIAELIARMRESYAVSFDDIEIDVLEDLAICN